MYGQMFSEKLRPLVDDLHNTILEEYDRDLQRGIGDPEKRPQRVVSWGIVARSEYAKESDDVKMSVEKAVEDEVKMRNLLEEGLLLTDDKDVKLSKLEG